MAIDGQKLAVRGADVGPLVDGAFPQVGDAVGGGRDRAEFAGLHKQHGLQGPIDDAFLDSFIFVSPTGTPTAPGIAKWVAAEQKHAIKEWRRQFRGEAQVRDDKDITDADIASSNLVLWGDPGSNKVLARIADKLPVQVDRGWTGGRDRAVSPPTRTRRS